MMSEFSAKCKIPYDGTASLRREFAVIRGRIILPEKVSFLNRGFQDQYHGIFMHVSEWDAVKDGIKEGGLLAFDMAGQTESFEFNEQGQPSGRAETLQMIMAEHVRVIRPDANNVIRINTRSRPSPF